jgi:pimeloyl-ACP methyl ester carboxylesterase
LRDVKVPTLILHGTSDPFTPLDIAKVMEREIGDAKLVVYEGGAHTLPIEYPDEINAAVRAFLTTS